MKCKYCSQETPDGSVFCCFCGERVARKKREKKQEIKVPKPRKLASGTWFAQVMVDGERVPISAPTEAEYYVKARAAKSGLIEAHKPDNRYVKDLVADYIKAREGKISPATIDGYERKAKYNLQSLYKLRVKELTKTAVQKAINEDAKKYAGKTIWEAWSLVQSATGVRYGDDELVIPSKKPKKKPPVYSFDDLKKLILALADYGGQVECAALLAVWLSLRRSEIKGLKWTDVRENSIRVQTARVYDKHHKLVEKDTKNDTSERVIPCDKYILDKINALPKESSEYVFTMSTAGIWKGIDTVCKNAGIAHGYLHGFRHTNASIMEYLGIPPQYSNKRGGWASDHVRQRTYTDAMPEGDTAAANKIDTFYMGLITNEITNEDKKVSDNASFSAS